MYSLCTFISFEAETLKNIGIGSSVVLAVGESLYYFWRSRMIMRFVGEAIN